MNLQQAAAFMQTHPVTLKRAAAAGDVPASKPFGKWLFLRVDLRECIRAQYQSRVLEGVHEKEKSCHSLLEVESGGASSEVAEKQYRKALGLPTK